MAVPSSTLDYGSPNRAWELFFRKLGVKLTNMKYRGVTALYDMTADAGTTFPRQIGICVRDYATAAVAAPATNTVGDQPTGVGDLCVYILTPGSTGVKVPVAIIDIYRCTAYTNTTTFTWSKIVD